MVLLLLFTLTSFALASSGDQFDEDELPFLEITGLSAFSAYSYLGSLTIGIELGVLFTILRLEFLKSHIGEKRPSRATRGFQLARIAYLLETASTRLCSAVFLLPVPQPLAPGAALRLSSHAIAPPDRVQRNVSILLKEVCKYV